MEKSQIYLLRVLKVVLVWRVITVLPYLDTFYFFGNLALENLCKEYCPSIQITTSACTSNLGPFMARFVCLIN